MAYLNFLGSIYDVDAITTPPLTGDVLKFNGTKWVPAKINIVSNNTTGYDDDLSAAGGGVSVGEPYMLSSTNVWGMPHGTIKIRIL